MPFGAQQAPVNLGTFEVVYNGSAWEGEGTFDLPAGANGLTIYVPPNTEGVYVYGVQSGIQYYGDGSPPLPGVVFSVPVNAAVDKSYQVTASGVPGTVTVTTSTATTVAVAS